MGVEDDDPRAGVKEESDRSAATRLETEAEEWWESGRCDNVAMEKGSTVVRGTMDFKQGTVGADDEWRLAQDRNEAMVTEACFGKDIFGFGEDNGGGEKCFGSFG